MQSTSTKPAAHSLEPTEGPLTREELNLAFRNRGLPLESLRYDLTPAGLHYILVHWDIPAVDPATWRLSVGGSVDNPFELTLEDVKARPGQSLAVTMECAGNGRGRMFPRPLSVPWLGEAVGTAEWTGTSLWPILEEAGLGDDVVEIVFRGADRGIQGEVDQTYGRSLSLDEVHRPEVMLAYEMNGQPLLPQHGHPLRLVVPGWYGMTSVKWLTSIEAVTEPFDGFQQTTAYLYQQDADDPGEPVTRMRVRALMMPPGVPDFYTHERFVSPGPTEIFGRAWSGRAPVEKVEVSVDDGPWVEAGLDPALGEFAWRGWRYRWDATPGDHSLACRATDAAGEVQPLEEVWNYQGMGNNAVQRVRVTVTEG